MTGCYLKHSKRHRKKQAVLLLLFVNAAYAAKHVMIIMARHGQRLLVGGTNSVGGLIMTTRIPKH